MPFYEPHQPPPHQPATLFFAVMPDGTAIAQANRIANSHWYDRRMSGPRIAAHRLHVTLFPVGGFVGGIPSDILLAAQLAGSAVRAAPFEIVLDHARSFPRNRGKRPYVLQGGDGVADLLPFQQQLGGAMARAGLHIGGYTFNPHMTLCYDPTHHTDIRVEPVSWIAREFVLIESWVGLTKHHVRGRWRLGDLH